MGTFFLRAFKQTSHETKHFSLREAQKIPNHFDLYFRIDHGDYADNDLPLHLKPSIFLAIDTHLSRSRKQMENFVGHYDVVFCVHHLGAQYWKQKFKNVHWLAVACDLEIHRRNPTKQKTYDIAFVGGPGGNPRKFILQMLREGYAKNFIGKYHFLNIADIYTASKIGVNFSIHHDINMRVFETMACETLLITNEIKDPMLKILFKEGEDLIIYKDIKELYSKINYFLKHENERKEIAASGYRKTVERHTYLHRVKEILGIAKEHQLIA